MTKIAGYGPRIRIRVRGMDPRIRIHTKMSWIRNNALMCVKVAAVDGYVFQVFVSVSLITVLYGAAT
jgi:hypothetical protein